MNITKVFTIVFSKIKSIEIHNSQLAGTEQKCIEMDELAKQDHTYHLSREEFKRYQGQWYLTLNKSGKNAPMRLRPIFELQSLSKTVFIENQVRKLQNQYLHSNTGDSTLLKRFLVGHVQKLVELMIFFQKSFYFFCYSWFRLQSMAIHCNRRGV